jgi:hypothetical protein
VPWRERRRTPAPSACASPRLSKSGAGAPAAVPACPDVALQGRGGRQRTSGQRGANRHVVSDLLVGRGTGDGAISVAAAQCEQFRLATQQGRFVGEDFGAFAEPAMAEPTPLDAQTELPSSVRHCVRP